VPAAGRLYASIPHLTHATQVEIFHSIGFVFLAIDFCVSGVPVRLLHFVQPLGVSLLYNVVLLIFSYVTRTKGPFYRVADYFSHDTDVGSFLHHFAMSPGFYIKGISKNQGSHTDSFTYFILLYLSSPPTVCRTTHVGLFLFCFFKRLTLL